MRNFAFAAIGVLLVGGIFIYNASASRSTMFSLW